MKLKQSAANGTQMLRCALVLAVILGAVLGFWASSTNEHSELPGVKSVVQVQSWGQHGQQDALPAAQILGDLGRIATHHGAKILVEVPSLDGRVAYVAGEGAGAWQRDGLRGLPWGPNIEVRPLNQLPHGDYRQMFELTGGKEHLREVRAYLDAHGVKYQVPSNQLWTFLLAGTALGKVAALVIGIGFALAFIGIVLNSHTDAVRRLHGVGLVSRVKAEFAAAGRGAVPMAIVAVAVLDGVLWGYSNAASAQQLVLFQSVFIGIALVACVLALFVGLFVLKIAPVVQLLKGKLPARSVLLSMFVLRFGACIAVASLAIGAVNYTTEWNRQDSEVAGWQSSAPAYGLTLSGARELEQLKEVSAQLASRLRELSATDRLLYAQYRDSGMSPDSNLDRDFMVYNAAAAEQSLSGEMKRRFDEPRSESRAMVLVPESLSHSVEVDGQVASILKDAAVEKVAYRAGDSRARTWEVGLDEWMNRSETLDPIVVIMPNSKLDLTDRNLVAGVTQRDVLLRSYEDFEGLQRDDTVGSFVRSAVPMSQTWAEHHQAMGRILWVYVGGLVASILLCLIASFSVWTSFVKVFHQRIRAAYLHARWPVAPILTALFAEVAVGIGILNFLHRRAATAQAWEEGGVAEGAADPAMIALFHVPEAAWWAAIALFIFTSIPASALLLWRRTFRQLVLTRR